MESVSACLGRDGEDAERERERRNEGGSKAKVDLVEKRVTAAKH